MLGLCHVPKCFDGTGIEVGLVAFDDPSVFVVGHFPELYPLAKPVKPSDWACDWVGPGIAELVRAARGSDVTLTVNGEAMGQSLQSYVRHQIAGRLHTAASRAFSTN